MDLIALMIMFIVWFLAWQFGRFLILPQVKVLLPALWPRPFWNLLYRVMVGLANAVFNHILMFLMIVYVIWWIIHNIVPSIFRGFLKYLPPMYPLELAGVMQLIDSIVWTILSALPFSERLKRITVAIATFLENAVTVTMAASGVKTSRPAPAKDKNNGYVGGGGQPPEDDGTEEMRLDDAQSRQMREELQLCMEENTRPVYPEMSGMERASVLTKNSVNATMCKVKQLQTFTRMMMPSS